MQYIAAKMLTTCLVPANWIVLAAIFWLLLPAGNWKKRLGIFVSVLVLLFSNPLLFRQAVLQWQLDPGKISGKYPAVILPGGLSGYDREGKGYFGEAADRFIQTANLYHQGLADYVLVTGGNGSLDRNRPPESLFLRQELIKNGIPANRILIESRSRNTWENAFFSAKIADSMHFTGPCILATSAMHLRRCVEAFKKAGMPVIAYPCNFEVAQDDIAWYNQLWPDLSLTVKWGTLIKEWVGWIMIRIR